jgi:hypothetical protein
LAVVSGAKGNGVTVEGNEALVRDGGAVGVVAEVAQDMVGSIEGRFGVGVPFDSSEVPDKSFEGVRILQMLSGYVEDALTETLLEAVEELAAE